MVRGFLAGIDKKGIVAKKFHTSKAVIGDICDWPNEYLINNLCEFQNKVIEDEYEARWNFYKKQYHNIKICAVYYGYIGEFIARVLFIHEEENTEDTYIVVLPDMSSNRIANKYAMNLLDRRVNKKIEVVHEDNVDFWKYVIKNHYEELDAQDLRKYINYVNPLILHRQRGQSYVSFNDEERKTGDALMCEYGISDEYVCFAARTAAYNNVSGTNLEKSMAYDYRNMDFRTYNKAVKYLRRESISAVRMGRCENLVDESIDVIDYAGKYANDFMDFYIMSKCKFAVCCPSGIVFLPFLFGIPVLYVNAVLISFANVGAINTGCNYYIPKKMYSKKEKRYLTIREYIPIERKSVTNGKKLMEAGIEFVDNTEEEIIAAVQEMNERLNGTWVDNERDLLNQQKYEALYKEMQEDLPREISQFKGPIPAMICSSYLRNNEYLLD